jgi:hypothetical protein
MNRTIASAIVSTRTDAVSLSRRTGSNEKDRSADGTPGV